MALRKIGKLPSFYLPNVLLSLNLIIISGQNIYEFSLISTKGPIIKPDVPSRFDIASQYQIRGNIEKISKMKEIQLILFTSLGGDRVSYRVLNELPSGLYYYSLFVDSKLTYSRKMVLIK
jgi:hypothetical protein